MAGRDIIVVGASAGGVEALCRLVTDLPADLPAAVFVVLHMGPHSSTALPRILSRRTTLPVDQPRDGDRIEPGTISVALPDHHLLLSPGTIRITNGPRENGHRPSIDTLFRTAAAAYGQRVVGVVLSGTRDDGTAGLRAIHERGGVAVVQDPVEALFPGMPLSAIAHDPPDLILPVAEIATHLTKLATEEPQPGGRSGTPSGFSCPECHGVLWEIEDEGLPRYRCRVGHGFSADSLLVTQRSDLEAALWTAYRALEERAALCGRLADRALDRRAGISAEHFRVEAAEISRQAQVLSAVLWGSTPRDEGESRPAG